jgi:hypothetical protein
MIFHFNVHDGTEHPDTLGTDALTSQGHASKPFNVLAECSWKMLPASGRAMTGQ